MALCSLCGAEIADSVKFCTACGKPVDRAVLVSARRTPPAVCPACGASADSSSAFCTICGHPLQPAQNAPAPGGSSLPSSLDQLRANAPPGAYCTACGSRLNGSFCTFCGHPANAPAPAIMAAPAPSPTQSIPASATPATPVSSISTAPAGTSMPATTAASASTAPAPDPAQTQLSETAAQAGSAPSSYIPAEQPSSGGGPGKLVLLLVLVIILCAAGAWYFRGVETVVVCSPPNVKVFLDEKEVTPTSYGRYVISHLSRKPHLLKVQSPGFADTIQRLDFPLTSSREWVIIRLVPSRR